MRTLKERLLDFKAWQESGEYDLCPRCGCDTMKPDLYSNALSRVADIMVCDTCGLDEAKLAFMRAPASLSTWACLQPNRPADDFKATHPSDAQVTILNEQLPKLIEVYKAAQKPEADLEALRLDAYETLAGLTTLWLEPFQASYDALGGRVLIRLQERDGGIAVAANIIPDA